jgi:hypothetical protein
LTWDRYVRLIDLKESTQEAKCAAVKAWETAKKELEEFKKENSSAPQDIAAAFAKAAVDSTNGRPHRAPA